MNGAKKKHKWTVRLIAGGFIALMIASAGAALFPDLIKLTQPILCAEGEIDTTKHRFEYGTTRGYTVSAHCVTSDGDKHALGTFTAFITLFGILIIPSTAFIMFLGGLFRYRMRSKYGPNYQQVMRRIRDEKLQKYKAGKS